MNSEKSGEKREKGGKEGEEGRAEEGEGELTKDRHGEES